MNILLTSTDLVSVITSAAVTVDVSAAFMDASTADPPVVKGSTSGPQLTAISTATTTTVVAAPAASVLRNVKGMAIRNKHATTACDITVQFNRSATLYELFKVTLLAGETLEFVEGVGFWVVKQTAKLFKNLRVSADVINATVSFADVTGLTWPVESGKHYNFVAHLYHLSNATTTGAQFGVNGPAITAARFSGISTVTGSATAAAVSAPVSDVVLRDTAIIVQTTGSITVVPTIISGWFNPSAAGTFAIRCASEVAVAAGLTVKQGSFMQLWEADN